MSEVVIECEQLGKRYRIGEVERYKALRDSIAETFRAPVRWFNRNLTQKRKNESEQFWALNDVSFDVRKGEVVGIIGRNGAGKSTLLKILSRITKPTVGMVSINGRVGSLLEVGTGFHPELTGRENIFLNGAILGMKRVEIQRRFDDIVAFAEIEKFLDMPVKRYSSGMYVRLAFAVAAHLETEILIIDEVLAVGDASFQKKCLGKIDDVAKCGRTILFVSHNMAAVLALCSKAILLDKGKVEMIGSVREVVEQYSENNANLSAVRLDERTDRVGNGGLRITSFRLLDDQFGVVGKALSGQSLTIALEYNSNQTAPLRGVHLAIGIHSKLDEHLFHLATDTSGEDLRDIPPSGVLHCRIGRLPLQPGTYPFNLYCVVNGEIADWIRGAGTIEVESGDYFGTGRLPPTTQGVFLVDHNWSVPNRLGLNEAVFTNVEQTLDRESDLSVESVG